MAWPGSPPTDLCRHWMAAPARTTSAGVVMDLGHTERHMRGWSSLKGDSRVCSSPTGPRILPRLRPFVMVVQCRRGSGNGARTHWTWTGNLSLLEVVRAEKGALDGYAIVNAFLSCSNMLRLVERHAMFDVCFGLADGIRCASLR